jgi:hypothetical protein
MEWYYRESPVVSNWGMRLAFNLGHNFELGGEISRIDLDIGSGGYNGVLLGNRAISWRGELRFPLIQRALAKVLQRPEGEIHVGFQSIDGTQLELTSFPPLILDESEGRARELAITLSSEWHRQKRL